MGLLTDDGKPPPQIPGQPSQFGCLCKLQQSNFQITNSLRTRFILNSEINK